MVEGADRQARQRTRVKEVGFIVFEFTLREEQIEAIWTLSSEQRDLLPLYRVDISIEGSPVRLGVVQGQIQAEVIVMV